MASHAVQKYSVNMVNMIMKKKVVRMQTFRELYQKLLRQAAAREQPGDIKEQAEVASVKKDLPDFDPHHLDCLLNPDQHPPVWRLGLCTCPDGTRAECYKICPFDALQHDGQGNAQVDQETCTGCGACIEFCPQKILAGRIDVMPVLEMLRKGDAPVYALIAPAFISQFSDQVTPGKLRSAFKRIGFAGMIEVALFADILTLKEAFEFDRYILKEDDFLLTSCCCPIWIGMIRKSYHQLISHIPPSVSPMIACGRAIRKLVPGAKTVFIGPCIAKKAEAREPDIRDAIDHVLTFQEIWDIFQAASINPADYEEDLRDHSSAAGRKYARTSGVSEAVQAALNRIRPGRPIPLQAMQGDGVPSCKVLLGQITGGGRSANYIEGMGCIGGCVGGPKSLIDKETGKRSVDRYSHEARYETPIDNPYVVELLHRLGFDTAEELLEGDNLFIRRF
jgi:iron only hydrogenase large subunit-like protein